MLRRSSILTLLVLLTFLMTTTALAQEAPPPAVRAVLFFSPTCPHCQTVMTESLPPLIDLYGDQLQIIVISTAGEGINLYASALDTYGVAPENWVVPIMFVGEHVLIGGAQIPQMLPGIIEAGLATGGIDWPDFPGMEEVVAEIYAAETPVEASTPTAGDTPVVEATVVDPVAVDPPAENPGDTVITSDVGEAAATKLSPTQLFAQDPLGNGLSVVVLLGMIVSIGWVGYIFDNEYKEARPWPEWLIPLLVLIGFIVAMYLSFIEFTQTTAVCGPVGDCNTVNQSKYAFIFGIPVGAVGVMGFTAIFIAWLVKRYGPDRVYDLSALAVWGMALVGTLFSIYLTFLEPFVIGATCAWCLTSAIAITLIMLAGTPPAIEAWRELRGSSADEIPSEEQPE